MATDSPPQYLLKIIPFLDKHLVLHMLEYLEANKVFSEADLLKAKFDVVCKTYMLDFAIEVYQAMNNTSEVPEDLVKQKEAVLAEFEQKEEAASRIVEFFKNNEAKIAEAVANKQFNMSFVESHGLTAADVQALYKWAKLLYETGQYGEAADLLIKFRDLSNDNELTFAALWGILACQILNEQWDAASVTLTHLRDLIDSKSFVPPLVQLQQRTWLIHWALFVFFNHPHGRTGAVEWFFNERYLNVIQTTCPHILRYLSIAVIANKNNKKHLKELVKVVEQETYEYTDSITGFVEELYINFDFDAAETKLRLAEKELETDYFAHNLKNDFIENARFLIFETYCKIHNRIDIKMLSERLGLPQEQAEIWVVNLIRKVRLDAKIDSQANQVLLGSQVVSPYQQLLSKTAELAMRCEMLSNNIEKARQKSKKATAAGANE